MYYQKLKENLFVDIPYPKEITDLIGKAEPWKNFCSLPFEIKNQFTFPNHQQNGDPGYKLRSKSEGREDKEYFHIYPEVPDFIKQDSLSDLVESTKELKIFFEYADEVNQAATQFAEKIGKGIGEDVPDLLKIIEDGKLKTVFRLLHYMNDDQVESIANQHFDRSLYTLHLYESDPGLQFLNWDMKWTDAPIAHGKTVVFNGYRLEKLTEGKIQKTWHRVARKPNVKDRISMVFFVWTDVVEDYDREAKSQDLEPSYQRN